MRTIMMECYTPSCGNVASARRLEPGFQIQVHAELLAGIDAARHVEAEQSIEKRHAGSNAAHGPNDLGHPGAITGPANIGEDRRTHPCVVGSELRASHPE